MGMINGSLMKMGLIKMEKNKNINKWGYNINGIDRQGLNRDHYNINGYNINGLNADHYNINGYNNIEYDIDHYNINGYNRNGIDRKGNKRKTLKKNIPGSGLHNKRSLSTNKSR